MFEPYYIRYPEVARGSYFFPSRASLTIQTWLSGRRTSICANGSRLGRKDTGSPISHQILSIRCRITIPYSQAAARVD